MHKKKSGGVTGKGFVEGDPRINRTIPGPGRPAQQWKALLARHEGMAIKVLAQALRYGSWASRRQVAEAILDRLHGRPTQPIQQKTESEQLVQYMTVDGLRELVVICESAQARAAKGQKPQGWPGHVGIDSSQ